MISMKNLLNENENESYCNEYFVENYHDIKEFKEFMESYKSDINEAEYQGRKVKLGKPMQGDVKKFKVYVKNPQGNVVKVNFGHKGKGGEKTMKKYKMLIGRRLCIIFLIHVYTFLNLVKKKD